MIDGESVAEAALRLSVSTRTVHRSRGKIRAITKAMLRADEVAA
jgi:hypothetical protein